MEKRDPTTPEPMRRGELPEASPRRPRRHVMKPKEAPSSLFLESISTADIAIPTVEVQDLDGDIVMIDSSTPSLGPSNFLTPEKPDLRYTTPPPKNAASHPTLWRGAPKSYRLERDCDFGEESLGYDIGSIGSDFSERSFCSTDYASNDSCTSPESEASEAVFGSREHSKLDNYPGLNFSSTRSQAKKLSDGYWSSEMNKHLWRTYEDYKSDPTTTPFYSASPPEGVYRRVAAQAKKTWKDGLQDGDRSYHGRWPHSGGSTRAHLKEMVKRELNYARVPDSSNRDISSPLLGGRALRNRFTTPGSDEMSFSTRDIAVSLTASTSESMQPDGPLAQLTRDPGSDVLGGFVHMRTGRDLVIDPATKRLRDLLAESRKRYGSPPPFIADTYNPGSPKADIPKGANTYGGASPLRDSGYRSTVGVDQVPRLQSPVRLSSPGGKKLRPIFLTQTFMEMSQKANRKHRKTGSNARDASPELPRTPRSPRSRRPVLSTEAFRNNPVLPPGWGSGLPVLRLGEETSSQAVVHSDPVEGSGPDNAAVSSTDNNNTLPRERVRKRNRNPRMPRLTGFDKNYFRRFNEEQARNPYFGGSNNIDMDDGSTSGNSSSSED